MKSRVLLFDYGGVLGNHHQEPAESALADMLGVNIERCRELTSERSEQGRAFREDRISETEFWNSVFRLAGKPDGPRPEDAILSTLWAETYALSAEVCSLMGAARARVAVGVLTNIDRARSAYLSDVVGLQQLVDIYLPSYQFGAVKPYEALWRGADAEVRRQFPGSDVVYIDDRSTHSEACRVVGWHGVLYTSVSQLTQELTALHIL